MLNGKEGVIVNLGGIANITIVKNNKVFLYFLPELQGQGSLRPIFSPLR
jgi:hypothetical protein